MFGTSDYSLGNERMTANMFGCQTPLDSVSDDGFTLMFQPLSAMHKKKCVSIEQIPSFIDTPL